MPTHYDTLGVAPSATDAEVREAYRRLAREHHPDRLGHGSAAATFSMPEINEAYRVLGDPARRAVYDASLRGERARPAAAPEPSPSSDGGASTARPMHPSHLAPARFPWRSMLVVAVIGIIGVVVLAQFTDPGDPPGPDGILRVGDCVAFEANGDAREVVCTGDGAVDLRVEAFVPFDAPCPGSTEPHRDRQGMGVACVALPQPPSG